jgi:hypothetical protein
MQVVCNVIAKKGNIMSAIIQFDFFERLPTRDELIDADIKAIAVSTCKVRRKLFAENGQLKTRMYELESRLEILEAHICRERKI